MESEQLIKQNLFGIDPDVPIYRIAKVGHLVGDIGGRCITVGRVIAWDDTHEAAFFRRSVEIGPAKERAGLEALAQNWFGQCWSTLDESDAMWRIYNADGLSVRIQTTPRILMREILKARIAANPGFADISWITVFMGAVKYHTGTSFSDVMSTPVSTTLESSGKGMAHMMLQKRQPFSHENEVRLLYHVHPDSSKLQTASGDLELLSDEVAIHRINGIDQSLPKFIRLPFDWRCITAAVIGPRADEAARSFISDQLNSVAPWMGIEVSMLYGPPRYAATF